MPTDYYPRVEGDRYTFLTNFMNNLGPLATGLGFAAADTSAMGLAVSTFQAAVTAKLAKKTAAQAAVAACASKDKLAEDAIRSAVRRIKAHPTYTLEMGRGLGIESSGSASPASAGPGGGPRPDLEAVSIVHGEVELKFIKNGFTGVEIECMRGTDVSFNFLARDTEAPYVDTRANLTDGPETRHYRARYLQKDNPTADYSDVLVVTVPGRA